MFNNSGIYDITIAYKQYIFGKYDCENYMDYIRHISNSFYINSFNKGKAVKADCKKSRLKITSITFLKVGTVNTIL